MRIVPVVIQAPPLLVDRHAAAAALSISESTLEAFVRSGELPRPRRISKGRTGWLWRELLEFAESLPVSDAAPGPGRAPANGLGRMRRALVANAR